jgi:hypothetical protein
MIKARVTVWLCFLLIALVALSCVGSIWERAHDPIWARIPESRWQYDVLSAAVALYSVAVTYGLWRKREWGRISGISLFAIVFFMFIGVPLLAPLLTSGGVPIEIGWWPLGVGALCVVCIILLSSQPFRRGNDV